MTATVIFLGVFTATIVVAWAVTRCRAWRQEAREKALARQAVTGRHPSRVPGLPRDGEPLDEAPDGEAERFAALWHQIEHAREPKNSPPAEGKR